MRRLGVQAPPVGGGNKLPVFTKLMHQWAKPAHSGRHNNHAAARRRAIHKFSTPQGFQASHPD
eukprot:CAMPEP_0183399018 /NCGR_PEP_ID=MMETSP0370-20130417/11645_1 /TAXON_ID=268820 /ORGANISM="Peridinium aciculiferum, Strain PAER-2" /LENGTH=62 /DNA_ID=CAMNT_0025580105 /DNA_START=78 /DNA_END=266 /DNA_ORIENTATION=+